MASPHPELVVTRYLDGQPVAWQCSVCEKEIRPAHDKIYVSRSEIVEAFRKHCEKEHAD